MNGKLAWGVVTILLVVIVVLAWILFAVPRPAEAPTTATSTGSGQATTTASPEPLHTRVKVISPRAGATVGKSFSVTGEAPGNWYFEAVFPIQVRDKDNNKIGQTQGQASPPAGGDWITEAQVPFKATMTLDTAYSGSATLVLLRDNPSGLPENDDSFEVPITIE